MANARLAPIEDSETNRVKKNTPKKTAMQTKAVIGNTAITTPKSVATPLPPLNHK